MISTQTFFRSSFYWEDRWTAIFMLNSTERNCWYWMLSVQHYLLSCPIWMKSEQGEAWLVSAWWCGCCATFCVIWPAHTQLTGVCFPEQGRNKSVEMDCLITFLGEMKLIAAKTWRKSNQGGMMYQGKLWQERKYMWRNKMKVTFWMLKQSEKMILSINF